MEKIINRPNRYLSNDFVKMLKEATCVWEVLKEVPSIPMTDVEEHPLGSFRKPLGEKWKGDLLREFVEQIEHLYHHFAHDKPDVIGQKVVDSFAFLES